MARRCGAMLLLAVVLLTQARPIDPELAPRPAARPACAAGPERCARPGHTRLRGGSDFYSSNDVEEWDQLAQPSPRAYHEPCVLPMPPTRRHCRQARAAAASCALRVAQTACAEARGRVCREADEVGLEEEDDEELNAATFGDAADDEDSLHWDNVAVASEAMKVGRPESQPKGAPVVDAHLQHMLGTSPAAGIDAEGGKRQWLPQGMARAESL